VPGHVECLIIGILERFWVEHRVLVMINIEVANGKRSSFLQQRQELKNRGRELSKAFGTEENSHMVAKKWALRR